MTHLTSHVRALFALPLALLLLAFAPHIAHAQAQAACPAEYTVVEGDTISRIAQRCGVTVQALLEANPQVTNPSLIYAGQTLNMPGGREAANPVIAVFPASGSAGTPLQVFANRFPADTDIVIGFNRPGAAEEILATQRTTAQGALATQLVVPPSVVGSELWVVTARTADGALGDQTGDSVPSAAAWPSSGAAGSAVLLIVNNFPPNVDVQVQLGQPDSTFAPIGIQRTDASGSLYTQVPLPAEAAVGTEWQVLVTTQDGSIEAVSGAFEVTQPAPLRPTVTVSPTSVAPGANIQLAANSFPANTPVLVGMGRQDSEYSVTYRTQTNAQGSLNVVLQIPSYAAPNQSWVAVVEAQGTEGRASSNVFNVIGAQPPTSATAVPIPTLVPLPTPAPTNTLFNRAQMVLIAINDNGQSGQLVGCGDSAIPVEVQFEPTAAPLTAALSRLFSLRDAYYGQSGLYNALYQSSLQIAGVNIINGEAVINLTGTLTIGGACDAPRVQAQIEQTALQFSTVNRVSIFLNGLPLSSYLSGA